MTWCSAPPLPKNPPHGSNTHLCPVLKRCIGVHDGSSVKAAALLPGEVLCIAAAGLVRSSTDASLKRLLGYQLVGCSMTDLSSPRSVGDACCKASEPVLNEYENTAPAGLNNSLTRTWPNTTRAEQKCGRLQQAQGQSALKVVGTQSDDSDPSTPTNNLNAPTSSQPAARLHIG